MRFFICYKDMRFRGNWQEKSYYTKAISRAAEDFHEKRYRKPENIAYAEIWLYSGEEYQV
jgi:hypothetical protein